MKRFVFIVNDDIANVMCDNYARRKARCWNIKHSNWSVS
jgi:hypothetical protein